MAAVNVVLFFSADALDPLKAKSVALQIVLGVYLLVYVLIALYFFLQAIESLRPRQVAAAGHRPWSRPASRSFPLGIRFYEDILRRDVDDYKKAWQEVRIGQLNAELAVQAHALAEINRAKYAALRRLYKGLQIMTLMAVGLVALGGLAQRGGDGQEGGDRARAARTSSAPRERITHTGVKEPSGVAFHPGTGHLFVVGRRRHARRARRLRQERPHPAGRAAARGRRLPSAARRAAAGLGVEVRADPVRPGRGQGAPALEARTPRRCWARRPPRPTRASRGWPSGPTRRARGAASSTSRTSARRRWSWASPSTPRVRRHHRRRRGGVAVEHHRLRRPHRDRLRALHRPLGRHRRFRGPAAGARTGRRGRERSADPRASSRRGWPSTAPARCGSPTTRTSPCSGCTRRSPGSKRTCGERRRRRLRRA